MKTVIMGLGYIGLPTAALIAGKGIDVLGVDVNPEVVNSINQGKIHIVEPELDALVEKAVSEGKLKASLKPIEAEIFVIAVPTPFKGNYDPDLAYVESATGMIIPFLRESNLIILESTSPVGSTRKIQEWVYQERLVPPSPRG
jgi:UDP-N-acetyl-D-mannosaminuronic acid dehydrogenase